MELGSGSSLSSPSSSDSLNGLKFGQKIYFEAAAGSGDGAGGGQARQGSKPGGGGGGTTGSKAAESGRPPPAPAKKGRSGVAPGGGQPPRCQVEGCKLDLSDAKPYYSRHKVCGAHSKSPTVIVAGLQQRFCQQCSRFHQLPEFDQGKRSCRRRLAGHNERRRKPPPGSLLSSRYGSLSSSFFESSSRSGGFLMDFSAYPALNGRDSWPNGRASDRAMGNQPTATGKFLQHPWQSNPENPPSEFLLPGSAARTTYVGSVISSGGSLTGVSDSSRALSLLSTQPWGSGNQSSSLGANGLVNANGTPCGAIQPSGSHGEAIDHFSSPMWGFKGGENNSGSNEIPPELGLGQLSQPASSQYSGDLDASSQNGREYLGLEHSRGYNSSIQHMHWSL